MQNLPRKNRVRSYDDGLAVAALLCRDYALNLYEIPHGSDVALECAAIIDDYRKLVPTIAKNGYGSCQGLFSFLRKPKIDYTTGFPRK